MGTPVPHVVRCCRNAYAGRLVRDLQLRSAGTIHIVDDPAVAVGDAARQVQVVVKDLADALVHILFHVAVRIIQVLR